MIVLKNLEMVAGWLLVLGGLVLGLQGLLDYNLLYSVLGGGMLEKLVDLAIGASALWMAYGMLNAKRKRK